VELVVEGRKSHLEALVCLSETLFLVRNGVFSYLQDHFAMIVSLYWKGYKYFICYICTKNTI